MCDTHKCSEVIDSCRYSLLISGEYKYCDYLERTGHRRGCHPEECTKYEPRGKIINNRLGGNK